MTTDQKLNERDPEDVTLLLNQVKDGDEEAHRELVSVVYGQLRRIAQRRMASERSDHTLQATELVHEAYIRLAGSLREQDWDSRAHFYGAAAEAMRRILINYARSRNTKKRGGGKAPEPINVLDIANAQDPEQNRGQSVSIQDLVVADARVDNGPMFKRIRPRARGMAVMIKKRTSHIHVVLKDMLEM